MLHTDSVRQFFTRSAQGTWSAFSKVTSKLNEMQSQLPRGWGRRIACSYKLENILCGIVRPLAPEKTAQEMTTGLSMEKDRDWDFKPS